MTADELLADLNARIDRGMDGLADLSQQAQDETDAMRLWSKRAGLGIVKDWLRSYPQADEVGRQGNEGS